jgi:glycosyltransferase involved in cell wall biosynthesis
LQTSWHHLVSDLSKTVLYVENGVGFGGAVISLRTFLQHADRERFRPVLVHSLDDPKFASFGSIAHTVYLPKIGLGAGLLADIGRKLNLDVFDYAQRLARIARRHRADLIYLNNDFVSNLSGRIAGRMLGLPVILHERDIPAPQSRLARMTSGWATRYLAISTPVREALLRIGVPARRIRMLPEGLDLELYRPVSDATVAEVRASLGAASGSLLVVMCGMIMEWKGQHVLIEAARNVVARHPSTSFAIVGEAPQGEEAYPARLREQLRALDLESRVSFVGYRNDIPAVMQSADVVVHASTSPEPFGRVIIEGMAMARPVVATAIGAPPEIIRDGTTGILVPPGDAAALAAVLDRLLADPDLRRRIGDNALGVVRQRYAIQRHAMLIESVFEELFWGAPPALASAVTA